MPRRGQHVIASSIIRGDLKKRKPGVGEYKRLLKSEQEVFDEENRRDNAIKSVEGLSDARCLEASIRMAGDEKLC